MIYVGMGSYTALHVLAEASVDDSYWDDGEGHSDYYEKILEEWAHSQSRYAPVTNTLGHTPLEVAILTRNHRFFDALKDHKNILILDDIHGSDEAYEDDVDDIFATGTRQNTVTVNDLDSMLDWDTSVPSVIAFLQLPTLLVPVDHTLLGCDSFDFIRHFATGTLSLCKCGFV